MLQDSSRWRCLALLVMLGCVTFADRLPAAERPNLLVIVADDLGWADVGWHGSPIPTPHLDRLAREGVRLEQHYVAPMCSPTRAALLSGRYWSRFGVTGATNNRVFPFGTLTLARALKSVGYETAITGKWHLGSKPEWGPRQFGFDNSYGSLAGGVGPWDHRYKHGPHTRTWHRNDALIDEEGHVTDLVAAEAVRFIEADRDRPFFLYVPFTAVHHPLDEPAEWRTRGRQADPERPQYAACVMHIDAAIGQLIAALERTGQREKTLVVFFSDNGGMIEAADADNTRYPGRYPEGERLGRNGPLRGRKTQLYEGGIRVPALVNWPGTLTPGTAETPLHVVDWMPTLCALAGYKPDRDPGWDGRDIRPLLSGQVTEPAERVLYWKGVGGRSAALRQGDWKLLIHREKSDERVELYDLAHDPHEQRNLAAEQADRVAALQRLLAEQAARDDAVAKDDKPSRPDESPQDAPDGAAASAGPTPILFDTDMDTDCDDAGALALLHALADRGEVTLLATVVSSRHKWSAPCVEAINRYYGRPDLPIGVPRGNDAGTDYGSRYARQIASEFPTRLKSNDDAPAAVEVYRTILAGQPDRSVVVVTVGDLTNLRDLLASGPDDHSRLGGTDLIRQKVRLWVCMGGRYPAHRDPRVYGNFKTDPASAVIAARDWPTPVVFSGLGEEILTGSSLPQTPRENPVRRIYELYLGRKPSRPSWDPIAVLYAARPDAPYWTIRTDGQNHIFANGTNEWRDEPDDPRQRLLLLKEGTREDVQQTIERLMTRPPKSAAGSASP